jgi:flagellar basal-body rod modification protein FlgD
MTSPVTGTSPSAANQNPISNAAGGAMGKNEFLKLLVAQMTHQDPLNPMDGQQMASQLAQFSSVEQLMSIGEKLDAQAAAGATAAAAANHAAATGLIGRDVIVESDQIVVGEGGMKSLSFDVPESGGKISLRVTDAAGREVRNLELGNRSPGEMDVSLADMLAGLAPGTYTVAATCTAGSTSTPLATRTAVPVDGVRYGRNGVSVTSGSLSFPIGSIIAIRSRN